MFGLGATEIAVIAVVILVLFGAKRLPDFMKGIGEGIKQLRLIGKDVEDKLNDI